MKFLIPILLIIFVALQYRLWVGDGSKAQLARLEADIIRQQAENERIRARNKLLAAEIDALKNGTIGVEERARQHMGMIKEGETFFMIVDDPK